MTDKVMRALVCFLGILAVAHACMVTTGWKNMTMEERLYKSDIVVLGTDMSRWFNGRLLHSHLKVLCVFKDDGSPVPEDIVMDMNIVSSCSGTYGKYQEGDTVIVALTQRRSGNYIWHEVNALQTAAWPNTIDNIRKIATMTDCDLQTWSGSNCPNAAVQHICIRPNVIVNEPPMHTHAPTHPHTPDCMSKLLIDFNNGAVKNKQEEGMWIGNKGVITRTHEGANAGLFTGNDYLEVPFFDNNYFGSNVRVLVRFQSDPNNIANENQVLFSNGDETSPSIEMTYNPGLQQLAASLRTDNGDRHLTIRVNAMEWLTADYIYDGARFMVRAGSMEKSVSTRGIVSVVPSSLFVGGLKNMPPNKAYFTGFIDNFDLQLCRGL